MSRVAQAGHVERSDWFNFAADVLQRQALAQPERVAVIGVLGSGAVERWSFGRMAKASGRLAGALADAGVRTGDRIIILMDRNPRWMVAMCACLHIGALPVPCVSQISAAEVAYRIAASGARGAIIDAAFADRFASAPETATFARFSRGRVAGWHDLERIIDETRSIPEFEAMPAEAPALMYFTSGSSGMPKAVVHSARGVEVRCRQPWRQLRMNAEDVIWTTSDTGWTRAGSCLLFGPWMNGATSLIVEPGLSAQEKVDVLAEYGVTIFGAVATELRQIAARAPRAALPKLRVTLSAGEAMTAELFRDWTGFSGAPLVVGYGQTETATSTLTDPALKGVNGMIGAPLEGNRIEVRVQGRRAAAGEAGEIAFAGDDPGLMLGYWRNDRLEPALEDGWHRTGDTGYEDSDGNLFFVGRSDDIISSSGYRIGPTEVENALMRHPAVQDCAVAASPDADRGEVVKAFIVLRSGIEGSDPLSRELQQFVKSEIAPFKYPRKIGFVRELPRTQSGKISRRALRERELAEKRIAAQEES